MKTNDGKTIRLLTKEEEEIVIEALLNDILFDFDFDQSKNYVIDYSWLMDLKMKKIFHS